MIKSRTWMLIEKFKKEREQYEIYTSRITKEKISLAKSKVNEKDIKILKMLNTLKICTSSQIAKVIFKGDTHQQRYCNNHLKKLFELGCVDRFFPFTEKGSPQAHVVLAPIGSKVLQISNFRKITTLNQNWKHLVSTNEVFCHMSHKYKLTNFIFELPIHWEEKNKIEKLRVDLFCGFIKEEKNAFAMFEVDLGTEPISEIQRKIKKYNSYFAQDSFKKDHWQPLKQKNISIIPSVVFVFNEEKRQKNILQFIKSQENVVKFYTTNLSNLNL